jgi:hypothetical protein
VAGTLCTTGLLYGQSGTGDATSTIQALGRAPAGNPVEGNVAGGCEYLLDDGVSENSIGVNPGNIFWTNPFTAVAGCQIIDTIRVEFGPVNPAMPNTATVGLFVYEDNDDDGDPSTDVTLIWSSTSGNTVMNEDTQVFNDYAVGPVAVRGVFFVGVLVNGTFPAAIDQTASLGMSWAAINLTNLNDPLDAPGSLGVIDTFGAGLAGNWMLRALGGSGFPPCFGDTNGDNTIDVNDLNNVILDWGTDGSNNGGDITDNTGTGPPDGIVDVNDLNAIFVTWGDCDLANDECVDRVLVPNGLTTFSSVGATLNGSDPLFRCGLERTTCGSTSRCPRAPTARTCTWPPAAARTTRSSRCTTPGTARRMTWTTSCASTTAAATPPATAPARSSRPARS